MNGIVGIYDSMLDLILSIFVFFQFLNKPFHSDLNLQSGDTPLIQLKVNRERLSCDIRSEIFNLMF